jgi:ornithine cyclodeaminase/alanine dehydrogenase-like protein (mu-crystallin family)
MRQARAPAAGETLVLTRADVQELLDDDACIAAVETAFRLHSEGRSLAPGVLAVPAREGRFHVKAAGLELDRLYFAAKTNGNFPANPARRGLPAIQGVVVLCDAEDGRPLALIDSSELTLRRTAAATAVAARRLARGDARQAAICGGGTQGRAQLRALSRVLPLERASVYDVDAGAAVACARELSAELKIEVRAVPDLAQAVRSSDVCVTCTPSRRAFLLAEHVPPGCFVAGVGADSEDKHELDPALMAVAVVVVDDIDQCARIGDLHHALEAGALTRERVHAELADLVGGRKPGRRTPDEVTVFDSTGVAIEDVAAAAVVYERGVARGAGLRVRLGA